jgi:hypothetical protein
MDNQVIEIEGKSVLDAERESYLIEQAELITEFAKATKEKQPNKMSETYERLLCTNGFLSALDRISSGLCEEQVGGKRKYTISSLFLHECFKELTADRDEQFFFLTGAIVRGTYVLDQRLEFEHAKRSMVGVVGNQAATHRLLIKLEQFGHRLLAHFHSHPGKGFEATHPSGTDTGFQKRLEDAGYPSVAAIFSRDGYVRFFRLDNDLEIEIYGSGVEEHGKNSFRLTGIS